jgi:ABC-type molybdate transport system permease subunit
MSEEFAHIVSVDKQSRKLIIERLYADGRRELFTETALPDASTGLSMTTVDAFALALGENLLLDSPNARELLGL